MQVLISDVLSVVKIYLTALNTQTFSNPPSLDPISERLFNVNELIVTAGSSASLQNNVPDQMPQLSPVIKNVKPELEPVEMKEDPPSEDQVSLDEEDQLSDVEDPCEDLIPLSNDQIPPTNAQDPLTEIKMEEPELTMDETKVKMEEVSEPDIVGTGSGLATMLVSPSEKQEDKELIFSQSQQIASLTARCSNRQQQLNDVVALLRERDKTISTLRAERDVLASYIAERGGTGADRIQIQSVNKTVEEKKRNRRIFFFKRLRKSRQKTSENGQKTSDNEQKISILKRAVNIREISDIVGKHSLNIVEKSSLGSEGESSILNDVQHASKIKKSSVGLPKTSEVLQKPSIVVKPISDTKNPLLVNQLNSNKRDISSGRVQRSSVIRQKQSITIKPISEIIKGPSLVIEPLAKKSKISSLDVQSSSENRQKTSLVVQPESDVRQISPVGLPRTLESQQNALVIQIDGMHNTVLQPTLVRLDKCSGNGVKGGKG